MTGDPTWAERSVLVTGATGMVGSALTKTLVDAGARVTALVADHDPQSELIRSGTIARVTVVDGRLEDVAAVERAVAGNDVEVIFHLGAQTIVSTAHRSPRATLESNVQGTWNVLDVARLHPTLVRSVVVASSDKAYGESPVLPYTEDMPLAGTFPYEVSKSMTDLVSRSYALTYGVPVAIARCGNIYGPGDLNWSRIVPGHVPVDPARRAADHPQRRHVPPRLPPRRRRRERLSRAGRGGGQEPGLRVQLQRRVARVGAADLRGVLRGGRCARARAEDPRPGGRRDPRPVPRRVARPRRARLAGARPAWPTGWPARSPGTRTCSGRSR